MAKAHHAIFGEGGCHLNTRMYLRYMCIRIYTCTDMYDASDGCVHVPGQSWTGPESGHHKQNDGDDGIQSH